MEQIKNPKCNSCKTYWKPDETDILPSGLYAKSCKKCRAYQKEMRNKHKCEHNREKSICRDCGGGSICQHDKIKRQCRDCGGSSICIHNQYKSRCRDCNGGSICPHDKIKSQCRDCKGSSICPHDKQKAYCRDCNGSSFCPHDKRKAYCRDCNGSSFCRHNKRKTDCRDCNGSSFCNHDKLKAYCRDCNGSKICPHDKIKTACHDCNGSSFCPHDKQKSRCRDCNLPLYLINLQRRTIHRCLKLSNLSKTKHSIEYLGCSAEYFIEYFKKKMDNFNQFSEIEMTWDNIHIDHIKPISVFNLDDEEEFLSCCNYTNLQPLLAEVNLNKNCKWSDKDNVYWNENIKDKEYYDIYIPV